jgi:PAS domain S-box-containing protein
MRARENMSPNTNAPETAQLLRRLERERHARREAESIAERATRELYDREQSFRALFADNPFPMWVYDLETLRILEVNSAAITAYGYPREEFLEMTIEDIRPPEDLEKLRHEIKKDRLPLEKSGPWRHLLKDGQIIDVEIASHTLRFAEHDAALVLAQDITAQRELEAAKSAFLTAVSHQLRTPLTALIGFSRLMQEHDAELSAEQRMACIESIATNAQKLHGLVADLLDVDRLGRGVLEAHRRPIDVGTLTQRVVEDMDSGREVHVDAPALPAAMDPGMVERIVENLLANAVTHTPTDARISVTVRGETGGITISVEDDGPGIPEHLRDTIFRAFDLGAGGPEHSPGLGIGLSLVRHFALLHSGRAWVEERNGGGVTVRVFLAYADGAAG